MIHDFHSRKFLPFALAGLLLAFRLPAIAAGDLDPVFMSGPLAVPGLVTTDVGFYEDIDQFESTDGGNALAIQADQKLVVVGHTDFGPTPTDFAVTRFKTNGARDNAFAADGDGIVTTDFAGGNDEARGVAIQGSDQRIVVVGYADNTTDSDFGVARYSTGGTLHTGFNGTGMVLTDFGNGNDAANAVAIQPDGEIVVVGFATNSGSNSDFAIVRYNIDGSLDTTGTASFSGTSGKTVTDFGFGNDNAVAVAIQDDGKIVVAGSASNGTDADFALVRYNADGTLDTTFSTDGKVTTGFGSGDDFATSVVVQGDDKIVVAGYAYNGFDHDVAVVRYNADGSLDTAGFNSGGAVPGTATTYLGGDPTFNAGVALQSDGRILVASNALCEANGRYVFALLRLNTDGTADASFGDFNNLAGIVDDPFFDDPLAEVPGLALANFEEGFSDDYGVGVIVQGDGKIVVAGTSDGSLFGDIALARFESETYQPDLRIGTRVANARGGNIYNLNAAAQTLRLSGNKGQIKTVFIPIENDGTVADTFRIAGTNGSSLFKISYFNGTTNVTSRVVSGNFHTPSLAPGASLVLKARVTFATKLRRARNFQINAFSDHKATKRDSAKIQAVSTGR